MGIRKSFSGTGSRRTAIVGIAAVLAVCGVWAYFFRLPFRRGPAPLVVYCAHDSVYSEAILRDFEKRTGIRVEPRFDTEATKSLGLVNLLIAERDNPRCDVFWNNEPLGTMQLKREGVLIAYRGAGYERIPPAYKDPDGYWTGFAARLRVYIVNTDKLSPTEADISRALTGDLSRFALAKPLYGTTLVHYSLLWKVWGPERLKEWHHDVRRRGAREAAGNALVMNLVARGSCDLGWTDTDDFFVARDEGRPVAMLPIRVSRSSGGDGRAGVDAGTGETICIPNTVAIIKGTKRPREAEQLVDFLLSAETELALARSKSRQIPLGPVAGDSPPDDVRQLRSALGSGTNLFELDEARTGCLAWLKSEYLR